VLAFGRAAKVVLGFMAVIGFRGLLSAQAEDFEAGKSAPQLFASDCSSCHRAPRGLAKHMNSWSLNNFLREHYTASRASADTLSAYLLSQAAGIGGGSSKRSVSVAPGNGHRKRSTPVPPADIPSSGF
jgi:mono/diheme cytochrome c family protein